MNDVGAKQIFQEEKENPMQTEVNLMDCTSFTSDDIDNSSTPKTVLNCSSYIEYLDAVRLSSTR